MKSDAVVIGAGICGASAAFHLVAAGVDTTLVERSFPASGASGVAPGILTAGSDDPSHRDLDELKALAQREYVDLLAPVSLRLAAGDVSWTGSIVLATDEDEAAALQDDPRRTVGEWVEAEQVRQIDPSLRSQHGGIWFPEDGHANAVRITEAFIAQALHSGRLKIVTAEVVEIVTDRGEVRGVRTSRGMISAGSVICAVGCDEQGILAPFGVEVAPVRGQVLVHTATPAPRVVVRTSGFYSVARSGSTFIGATEERVGFDTAPDREKIEALGDAYSLIFGIRPEATLRTGFRSAAPDGLPVMGPHPEVAGLFVATGLYRNGVLLGPSAGRAIASVAISGVVPDEWRPFGVRRLIGALA